MPGYLVKEGWLKHAGNSPGIYELTSDRILEFNDWSSSSIKMETAFDIVARMKTGQAPAGEVLLELKNRNFDPVVSFRVTRMFYRNQEPALMQEIIDIYGLDQEKVDFNNPFTDDFISEIE